MADVVDYFAYKTHDLHGQWDYGDAHSQDGCPGGNCLRSHVNLTETMYALSMITKAGVPTNRIAVGIPSYGRSFGMANATCTGPQCFYTGSSNESTAQPGECTETGGFMGNAEIMDYVYGNQSGTTSWYDIEVDSNYVVYLNDDGIGSTWVAYMAREMKTLRAKRYKKLKFAGTVDWALDFAAFGDFDGLDDDEISCNSWEDSRGCDDTNMYMSCDDLPGPTVRLDDLSNQMLDSWPIECVGQYMLTVLSNMLVQASSNFTELMNEGYDDKFSVYAKSVTDSANSQVHDFMEQHGNDYFSCVVTEGVVCCIDCDPLFYSDNKRCRYCYDDESCHPEDDLLDTHDGNNSTTYKADRHWLNETEPCPPDFSQRGYGYDGMYDQTLYWTLRDDKADSFYADLLNATGIPKDKVGFGLYTIFDTCSGSGHKAGDGDVCWNMGYEFGAPFPKDYGVADVSNPKSIVQSGLNNSAKLMGQLSNAITDMRMGTFLGDELAMIDAISLPIFMIAQGIESMSIVIQVADKIEEEERKAIIIGCLAAVFFFVPIVGEVAGSVAEIGSLVALLDIIGIAGNIALDVYTIVDDPDNAPLAIVDLIMTPLALADVEVVAKAAQIQRTMKPEDLVKLGDRVGERMNKVKRITGTCTP